MNPITKFIVPFAFLAFMLIALPLVSSAHGGVEDEPAPVTSETAANMPSPVATYVGGGLVVAAAGFVVWRFFIKKA